MVAVLVPPAAQAQTDIAINDIIYPACDYDLNWTVDVVNLDGPAPDRDAFDFMASSRGGRVDAA